MYNINNLENKEEFRLFSPRFLFWKISNQQNTDMQAKGPSSY